MPLPPPLTLEQVRQLLAEGAAPTPADLLQVLRYLVQAQAELDGRARQLKAAVGRIGR